MKLTYDGKGPVPPIKDTPYIHECPKCKEQHASSTRESACPFCQTDTVLIEVIQ